MNAPLVNLDPAALTHPKFQVAGEMAFLLFVKALLYAVAQRTDGIVPKAALKQILPVENVLELATRLASNAVPPYEEPSWKDEGQFYRIHDFDHYQFTRRELEKKARPKNEFLEKCWAAFDSVQAPRPSAGQLQLWRKDFFQNQTAPMIELLGSLAVNGALSKGTAYIVGCFRNQGKHNNGKAAGQSKAVAESAAGIDSLLWAV